MSFNLLLIILNYSHDMKQLVFQLNRIIEPSVKMLVLQYSSNLLDENYCFDNCDAHTMSNDILISRKSLPRLCSMSGK